MVRGSTNNEGEYHLVVHMWFRNKEGKYLIQQRNKLTDRIPYQWFCTGGAATSGDTSLEAAMRETKEELGIEIEAYKFKHINRYFVDEPGTNYITDVYLIEEDILIKDLTLDKVEVKDVAYKTISEIKEMIRNKKFWNLERQEARQGYLDALEKN
jgi:8-oxo-dGTP pyrophosphatase MutT (NUDIX family)